MASVYLGVNRGQHEQDVAESTSTNSSDVELRYDTGQSLTRLEIMNLVRFIMNKLIKDNFPE